MKKVYIVEPFFFLFFGLFHLHRIWGLVDRASYADFWLAVMERKGLFYFALMCLLAALCIAGIFIFFKNYHQNFGWRYIYLFGGGYVLFDLFAIVAELGFWRKLLYKMFDVNLSYWNLLWSGFVFLGLFSFVLGCVLLKRITLSRK